MRILIVSQTYYPFLRDGDRPATVRAIAEGLVTRGHVVTVLTSQLGALSMPNDDKNNCNFARPLWPVRYGRRCRHHLSSVNLAPANGDAEQGTVRLLRRGAADSGRRAHIWHLRSTRTRRCYLRQRRGRTLSGRDDGNVCSARPQSLRKATLPPCGGQETRQARGAHRRIIGARAH